MNTKVIMEGDEYVLNSSWSMICNHICDEEEYFLEMLEEDGELEVSDTSDPPNIGLESFVRTVEIATTSAQMDGWDPNEEDED